MMAPAVRREVEAVAVMVALGRAVGPADRYLDAADWNPGSVEPGSFDRDLADRTVVHPPLPA